MSFVVNTAHGTVDVIDELPVTANELLLSCGFCFSKSCFRFLFVVFLLLAVSFRRQWQVVSCIKSVATI